MKRKTFVLLFVIISILLGLIWGGLLVWNPTGTQRSLLFFADSDWFMDFFNVVYWSAGRTPYTWGLIDCNEYLPIGYLLLYPFSFFYDYVPVSDTIDQSSYLARYSELPALSCAAFMTLSFGVLFYTLCKKYKGTEIERIGIMIALFLSGVTIYMFDRANEITLAIGVLFIYFLTYDSDNKLYRHIGYLCLAFSASLKLVPALFGILIVFKKRYKEAVITVFYGLAFAVLPFFLLKGSFIDNINHFFEGVAAHGQNYANSGTLGINHNTIFYTDHPYNSVVAILLFVLAIASSYFIKSDWKKLTLITLAMILVTGQQGYYSIGYLLFPLVMFLNEEEHKLTDLIWLLGFIIIFSPLQFDFTILFMHFKSRYLINTALIIMYLYLIIIGIVMIVNTIKSKSITNE